MNISLVTVIVSKTWIVDDELWELIEPVLSPWPVTAPGPRPVPDRLCLPGVLFVLHTGIGWEDLAQELGFGSGMTCWRRPVRWTEAGVRPGPPDPAREAERGEPDRLVSCGDGRQSHRREKGGAGTGPSPVNRGKPGSKHYLIYDGTDIAIHVLTSGANVPDISRALDLLDGYPPIAGRRGRPRRRFTSLLADKAYSSEAFRVPCRERGTEPIIPQPKTN